MLSIIIITRNTSYVVQQVIKSVKTFVDEIVVVQNEKIDRGKVDSPQTKEKIYYLPFENDFSKLRNFGISKAKNKWILVLDSDEQLSMELIEAIPSLIKDPHIDGYWFRRKTYISKVRYLRYGFFYPDYQLRLFRNKKEYRYVGAIHEQLTIPKERTKELPLDILHFPTNPKYTSWLDFKNMMPYIRIQATELQKRRFSIMQLFWLGCSSFWKLLFDGFIHGKGFLAGYAGFRAHELFSLSISAGYFLAWYKKIT